VEPNTSRGSVATRANCGGILNVHVYSQRVQKYTKSRTQNVKKKAMPTINTELTKNYNAMRGLL